MQLIIYTADCTGNAKNCRYPYRAVVTNAEELQEATFSFVKYYVQSRHYDELVAENEKLKKELESEIAWRTRADD